MMIENVFIILLVIALLIGVATLTYFYLRDKTLNDIRADVYQLFLEAEHTYLESGTGKQKMKWVIQKARSLLPEWAQKIITEDVLMKVVECWFQAIKDLLDDGRINDSGEGE